MKLKEIVEDICDALDVPTPKIKFEKELETPTQMAALDPVHKILHLKEKLDNPMDAVFAIAHELRHLWQFINHHKIYFEKYQNVDVLGVEQYNLQSAEVDANAFACVYCKDVFGMQPLFNNVPESVKKAIFSRAEEIEEWFF